LTGGEFRKHIEESEKLSLVEGERDKVTVRYSRTGRTIAFPIQSILDNAWEEIKGICEGTRNANLMEHISRVVGYYSRVHNWNMSKRAELRDRQAGDYAVERVAEMQFSGVEDVVVDALVASGSELACELGKKAKGEPNVPDSSNT